MITAGFNRIKRLWKLSGPAPVRNRIRGKELAKAISGMSFKTESGEHFPAVDLDQSPIPEVPPEVRQDLLPEYQPVEPRIIKRSRTYGIKDET